MYARRFAVNADLEVYVGFGHDNVVAAVVVVAELSKCSAERCLFLNCS